MIFQNKRSVAEMSNQRKHDIQPARGIRIKKSQMNVATQGKWEVNFLKKLVRGNTLWNEKPFKSRR